MQNSKLIYLLNQQFNREVSTLLRYMIEAAAIRSAEQEIVRATYLKGVSEKIEHAQYFADQIVALGGTPILKSVPVCPSATVRQMLRWDAAEEQTDEHNCLELASEAGKEKLANLKQKLEKQAAIEHERGYEMQCLLW